MKQFLRSIFPTEITKEQSRDTGMALVLVLLIFRIFTPSEPLLPIAIAALIVNMTFPNIFWPLAVVWLGFAHALGTVMSRIILAIVFFCVVTPVALARRLSGKDALHLTKFKTGTGSVMVARNHTFTMKDIEKPY